MFALIKNYGQLPLVLIIYFMMTNVMIYGLSDSTLDIFSSFRVNYGWGIRFDNALRNWTNSYWFYYYAIIRWC